MIIDIHNHTYYSGCGKDHPEKLIEAAIKGGIEIFGISDHNYGIDDRKSNYVNQLRQLAEKYKDIGIQIYTRVGDTNTPKNECANYSDVEKLWRIHFER